MMGIGAVAIARAGALTAIVMAAVCGVPALAQETPAQTPWVTATNWLLDSGGHMGLIRSVIITRDGKRLVSAGEDKAIRVWSVGAGDIVQTIRAGAGQGVNGRIYAMALSSDERWLAAAGLIMDPEQGHVIQLYDFQTGTPAGTLTGHDNVIEALAFSPDGSRLASASLDGSVRLWDMAGRNAIRTLPGTTAPVFGVGFTPDGARVAAGGADSLVRLWSAETGDLIAEMSGHKDKISALAVDRSGGMIASASVDGEIRLWDGRNGKFARALTGDAGETGALSFSPDGKRLLSTCGRQTKTCVSRIWDAASGKSLTTHAIDKYPVLAAAFSPDGTWAATGGGADNEIQLWDARTGKAGKSLKGATVGLWAYEGGERGLNLTWDTLFDPAALNRRGLPPQRLQLMQKESPGAANSQAAGRNSVQRKTAHGPLSLGLRREGRYNGDTVLEILKDGKPSARIVRNSSSGFEHRAYTFTAGGDGVISGGVNGALSLYDLSGRRLGDFAGHEGAILAAGLSRDGRYVVSSASDHTVRLWNAKTRELIASVLATDDGQWIMWTPQGFYACSPGADHYLGWRVEHGPGRLADEVAASQLRKRLNRPATVIRAIELASAEAAAKEPSASGVKLKELLSRPGPKIRVVSPKSGAALLGETAELRVEVAEAPYTVKLIKVEVNGRPIAQLSPKNGPALAPGEQSFRIPLDYPVTRVLVTGANDHAETVESVVLTRKVENSQSPSSSRGESVR